MGRARKGTYCSLVLLTLPNLLGAPTDQSPTTGIPACRDTKGRANSLSRSLWSHSRCKRPASMERHRLASWYVSSIVAPVPWPTRLDSSHAPDLALLTFHCLLTRHSQVAPFARAKWPLITWRASTRDQITDAPNCQSRSCTPALMRLRSALTRQSHLPQLVAYCSPVHRTRTPENSFPLALPIRLQ